MNTEKKILTLDVIQASMNPANDGNFYVTTLVDTPEKQAVNESGRYGLSYEQLKSIAGNHGLNSPQLLLSALNKGGCKIAIPATFCKEGEEFEKADGTIGKYTKDWWKADMIGSIVYLGDTAQLYVDKIQEQVFIHSETAAMNDTVELSRTRRQQNAMQRLALLNGGTLPAGALGITEDAEVEDITPAKAAKKG